MRRKCKRRQNIVKINLALGILHRDLILRGRSQDGGRTRDNTGQGVKAQPGGQGRGTDREAGGRGAIIGGDVGSNRETDRVIGWISRVLGGAGCPGGIVRGGGRASGNSSRPG